MTDRADRPLQVFLSHTSELRALPNGFSFIDAVEDAVKRAGHVVVDMDYMTAQPHPPAQVCREKVEAADVYVGVLGFRYGSPVREHPDMSYTELEFDAAQKAGKPLLVFLLDDATQGGRDLLVDLDHAREQEAFRRRVSDAGITRATAATPETLATRVLQALYELTPSAGPNDPTGAVARSRVWRVPPRNQVFTGRDTVLTSLRTSLPADDPAVTVVQALHGMGGIGKTALAIEYAHRYAADYDLVWWIPSEDPAMIPANLAECAQSLGLATASDAVGPAVARLQTALRDRSRWLLCYDNAEDPSALRDHLCSGPGHVLITSRNPNWHGVAHPIGLDVLDPAEAVSLLQARAPSLDDNGARRVAEALGYLPLALTQAGAYLANSGATVDLYIELLEQRARQVTSRGWADDYPTSFAASWDLAFDRLAEIDPAALQLLTISAYLAPEPIPFSLFTTQTEQLPEPLAGAAADPLTFSDLTDRLRRQALARVDVESLQLHRLVQAVLRDRHDHETRRDDESGRTDDPPSR